MLLAINYLFLSFLKNCETDTSFPSFYHLKVAQTLTSNKVNTEKAIMHYFVKDSLK